MLVEVLDVQGRGVVDHRTTHPREKTGHRRDRDHDLEVDRIRDPGLGQEAGLGVARIQSEQYF